MEKQEELNKVRNIIKAFLKAKKISRLYPRNNPIYGTIIKDLSDTIAGFFECADSLSLSIGKNDIFYNSVSVYHNPEKKDNLAILFFRDGLRELTIKKGLTSGELEDFLNIISQDLEDESVEVDVVTLLWERSFENIDYVVKDSFLAEGEALEEKAVREVKQNSPDNNEGLRKIYEDNNGDGGSVKDFSIFSLTDDDFRSFFDALEKESPNKISKLFNILFEIFCACESTEEYRDMVNHFTRTIEFCVKQGLLGIVVEAQARIDGMLGSDNIREEAKSHLSRIMLFPGDPLILNHIGVLLENGEQIGEQTFRDFVGHLKTNSIQPLLNIMGDLKSIHSRRMFIDALVHIGRNDISPLLAGISDSRWYVVRNIVLILRKIGDKKAAGSLKKLLGHEDMRVMKEVIRTLGELAEDSALEDIQSCLKAAHIDVRKAALQAIVWIGSGTARKIIMDHIAGTGFTDRGLDEKKEFFRALANWHDDDVYDFLVRMIKKRSFFNPKKSETRACAAYCLGLLDNRDALSILNNYKADRNKLLREFSLNAIRKLEYGN